MKAAILILMSLCSVFARVINPVTDISTYNIRITKLSYGTISPDAFTVQLDDTIRLNISGKAPTTTTPYLDQPDPIEFPNWTNAVYIEVTNDSAHVFYGEGDEFSTHPESASLSPGEWQIQLRAGILYDSGIEWSKWSDSYPFHVVSTEPPDKILNVFIQIIKEK